MKLVCLYSQWLSGNWFYRPEETFHSENRKFLEKVGTVCISENSYAIIIINFLLLIISVYIDLFINFIYSGGVQE